MIILAAGEDFRQGSLEMVWSRLLGEFIVALVGLGALGWVASLGGGYSCCVWHVLIEYIVVRKIGWCIVTSYLACPVARCKSSGCAPLILGLRVQFVLDSDDNSVGSWAT